jgi:hypothetical protein
MINYRKSPIYLLFLVIFLTGCSKQQEVVNDIVASVRDHFVPDSRTGIFDIEVKKDADNFIFTGETDNQESLEALQDSLERLNYPYINKVELLPEQQLGNQTWAITNVSVSNIRQVPKHSSELVTQGILGTPVKVLKNKGGWYLIQTPDKYLGWVNSGGIELKTREEMKDYYENEKIVFTAIYGFSYKEPDIDSPVISDLALGNVLNLVDSLKSFFKVVYPDGRTAYVKRSESSVFTDWIRTIKLDGSDLTTTANRLLGIPYLWGGTSSKALDCSGFTKTVYFMHGWILPRDASQQDHTGQLIDEEKEFGKLQSGDLLFFGRAATDSTHERVVHVGMWIGDMKFIHASGDVHVSSFDRESLIYDEYNLDRYLRTKRVKESDQKNLISVKQIYSGLW